jgi:hypothetical protein
MKLLIVQFSPVSCHFIPLRSRYSPQHPVLKHPQSVFFPSDDTEFHTHTKQQIKLNCVYVHVCVSDKSQNDGTFWTAW